MRSGFLALPLAGVIVLGFAPSVHAQNGKNPPGISPNHYQCYTVVT
jgi:hypothetical protein